MKGKAFHGLLFSRKLYLNRLSICLSWQFKNHLQESQLLVEIRTKNTVDHVLGDRHLIFSPLFSSSMSCEPTNEIRIRSPGLPSFSFHPVWMAFKPEMMLDWNLSLFSALTCPLSFIPQRSWYLTLCSVVTSTPPCSWLLWTRPFDLGRRLW